MGHKHFSCLYREQGAVEDVGSSTHIVGLVDLWLERLRQFLLSGIFTCDDVSHSDYDDSDREKQSESAEQEESVVSENLITSAPPCAAPGN